MAVITNMDMPKSCFACKIKFCCEKAHNNGWLNDRRDSDCPLKSTDDVVPMENIDKMIAEIEKLRGCSCNNSDGIIDDVVDIIEEYCKENTDEMP